MHQLDHLWKRKILDSGGLAGMLGCKQAGKREVSREKGKREVLWRAVVSQNFLVFHFSFEIWFFSNGSSTCYEAPIGRAQWKMCRNVNGIKAYIVHENYLEGRWKRQGRCCVWSSYHGFCVCAFWMGNTTCEMRSLALASQPAQLSGPCPLPW